MVCARTDWDSRCTSVDSRAEFERWMETGNQPTLRRRLKSVSIALYPNTVCSNSEARFSVDRFAHRRNTIDAKAFRSTANSCGLPSLEPSHTSWFFRRPIREPKGCGHISLASVSRDGSIIHNQQSRQINSQSMAAMRWRFGSEMADRFVDGAEV